MQDWVARAQDAYKKRTGRRGPRFTSLVTVEGADAATVRLRPSATHGSKRHNSHDDAAFEAWCLVLRCWADAERVILDWDEVPDRLPAANEQKYQQFLYRVANFADLFGDWFCVSDPLRLERSVTRRFDRPFYLNSAGSKEHPTGKGTPEDVLERALRDDPTALHRHMGFSIDCSPLGRQFPVGVFSEPVPSEGARIFPNGYVDLLCVDGRKVGVFELKAGGTPPIGTLSELFFYVSIIRDLVLKNFSIENEREEARLGVRKDAIQGANEIIGMMIGHQLPPWISDPLIFQTLNAAASRRWTSPKVSFRADRAEGDPPRFVVVAP